MTAFLFLLLIMIFIIPSSATTVLFLRIIIIAVIIIIVIVIIVIAVIVIIFMSYTDTARKSVSHGTTILSRAGHEVSHVTASCKLLEQSPPRLLGWHGGGTCRRQQSTYTYRPYMCISTPS